MQTQACRASVQRAKHLTLALAAVAFGGTFGCVNTTHPTIHGGAFAAIHARSPLLDDEHLLDPPQADDAMLGRILIAPYDPARPLADQLAPNPCADALVDVEARPREAEIEDAKHVADDGVSYAYYRFEVLRRVEKAKTKAYATCCQKASCGVGYVRALSFGAGELATGRPTLPGGDADVAFDDGKRSLELTLLSRHPVRGYLAVTLEAAPEPRREAPRSTRDRAPDALTEDAPFEVREDPHNPDRFEFCTRWECITENAFVLRYQARTQSHEIDDFERDHFGEARWVGAAAGALMGGLLIPLGFGLTKVSDHKGSTLSDRNDARVAGGALAGIGLTGLAMGAAFLFAPKGGGTMDHHLSKSQAKRFVERYNRALTDQR